MGEVGKHYDKLAALGARHERVCIDASTALRRDAANNFEALVGKENRNAD
jgi:hypothetical protein